MLALADLELPTADAEIWRYSRIADLDLTAFEIQPGSREVTGDDTFITLDAEADEAIAAPTSSLNTTPAISERWTLPSPQIPQSLNRS